MVPEADGFMLGCVADFETALATAGLVTGAADFATILVPSSGAFIVLSTLPVRQSLLLVSEFFLLLLDQKTEVGRLVCSSKLMMLQAC